MTSGAELRRLLAVKGLYERVPVRFRRQVQQRVMRPLEQPILARRKIVERGVLDREIALTHGALHVHDRMARRAGETSLGFRSIDLLLDGTVETAVEEDRMVVAAGAPLRWPRADYVLHVLDRLAIPLVVERREMMRRGIPLLVNVAMALPAGLAGEKEAGGDESSNIRVGRGRKERPFRTHSLLVHAIGHDHRVLNPIRLAPLRISTRPRDGRRRGSQKGCGERDAY